MDNNELIKLSAEACLYGYPLVYSTNEISKFPAGKSLFGAPVPDNTFGYAQHLLDPSVKFVRGMLPERFSKQYSS